MWKDPIVEEVRETRRRIMAKFNNDRDAYYSHLIEAEQKYRDRLVRPGPVRVSASEPDDDTA